MNHPWFHLTHSDLTHSSSLDYKKIAQRLKEFRAPQRLQVEALTFLVNNLKKDVIDFASLLEAFRALDKSNCGLLNLNEMKQAFKDSSIHPEHLEDIFKTIDFHKEGTINYSEFLAATVDKKKTLTMQNLWFAFHHFDVDNSGFITEHGLAEVFHREGRRISQAQIHEIMEQADSEHKGRLSFEDFTRIMKSTYLE
jgi:calcium-dependent protein kinase